MNFNTASKVGIMVQEVSRLRRKAINHLLQPLRLTDTQWWALTYISHRPGLTQARLADELLLGKVALSGMIDRLMKSGLIERRPDANDKRVNLIFLSKEGLDLVARVRTMSSGMQEDALRNISPEEIDLAVSVLERMKENLEKMPGVEREEPVQE